MLRLACLLCLLLGASAPGAQPSAQVSVRLLAINDFHGHIEPPQGSAGSFAGRPAGGAAYLATHLARLRAGHSHHIFVSAGDLINASPFASALFQDEPTIEVMNRLGLALNAVGNHEFDEGVEELRRVQAGGCHPRLGCAFRQQFEGARFRFLAANLLRADNGTRLFPAYEVRHFDGVAVAFIGLTLQGTRDLVNATSIAGWEFGNEWQTVNALVPELQRQGVEAIVLLLHEGGYTSGGHDECPGLTGPITAILEKLDRAVDVVVSGHTHQAYNCVVDGRLVTAAGSYGRLLTRIDLTIDRASGDVVGARAANEVVTRDVSVDPGIDAIVNEAARAAAARDRLSGHVAADLARAGMLSRDIAAGASGESVLGNLVADAQLWATRAAGAQIALMNPGGLRADIERGADGRVMFSRLFAVHPFSNTLVTVTLSGAQLAELLEQQFPGYRNAQAWPRVLQVSSGLSYAWSESAAPGRRIRDLRLHRRPIEPQAQYRVTVNDFLLSGGDRFAALRQGRDVQAGPVDVEALEAYFQAHSPVQPPALGRIRRLP
jgi:5'-nucleotidase